MSSVDTPMRVDPIWTFPSEQRLAVFDVAPLLGVERDELGERGTRQLGRQIGFRRENLPLEGAIRVRHHDVVRVDDRGEGDVLGIQRRLENRTETGVAAKRRVRIDALDDHLTRAVIHRFGEHIGARLAFFQRHAPEPRQVQQAQHHDDSAND